MLRRQEGAIRLRLVPAHGREARRPWSPPTGWTQAMARALNQEADDGAMEGPEEAMTVDRLASLRHIQHAKRWEDEVVEITINILTDCEEWHDRGADLDRNNRFEELERQHTGAGGSDQGGPRR